MDTIEKSRKRIEDSDSKNAKYIMNNQILKDDVVYLVNWICWLKISIYW